MTYTPRKYQKKLRPKIKDGVDVYSDNYSRIDWSDGKKIEEKKSDKPSEESK